MSIQSIQQMHLRKITVISRITLRVHFSLGIAKFDTLPNPLLTLGTIIQTNINYNIYNNSCLLQQFLASFVEKFSVNK